MTHAEIISDLKSRGERKILFHENGLITSWHGAHTLNTWVVENGELKCDLEVDI